MQPRAALQVSEDVCRQLESGMLFRLQAFANRHISTSNAQMELRISDGSLMIFSNSPDSPSSEDIHTLAEEIYMEMARIASLQQQHTECLRVYMDWADHFVVPEVLDILTREWGVQIRVVHEEGQPMLEMEGTPEAVRKARGPLRGFFTALRSQQGQDGLQRELVHEEMQHVCVFVDQRNISAGCQSLSSGRDCNQRLMIQNFGRVVAGLRDVGHQVVVDNRTSRQHPVWWFWQLFNFEVEFDMTLDRVVHQCARAIRDRENHVVALCTGDGKYLHLARGLAERGFQVEIWCWQRTCHHGYQLLADDPHLPLKLYYLDGFRDRITMARRTAPPRVADLEILEDEQDMARPNEAEEAQGAAVQAMVEAETCALCLSEAATVAFRPCNHQILCRGCAERIAQQFQQNPALQHSPHLGRCFICRTPWDRIDAL